MSRFLVLVVAVGLVALAGCGKKQGQLTGTVTFKGKPVESGEIMLTPDDKRGNTGPGVMVMIENGAFSTPKTRGHWGGAYRATVTGYKGREALFSGVEMQIDLPEGDTTYDLVVPDPAGKQAPDPDLARFGIDPTGALKQFVTHRRLLRELRRR